MKDYKIEKLENPIKSGSNEYPWKVTTDEKTIEYFSEKGKKIIEKNRGR